MSGSWWTCEYRAVPDSVLPWPSSVRLPAAWMITSSEHDQTLSVAVSAPNARGALFFDLRTGERVRAVSGETWERLAVDGMLRAIAVDRDLFDTGQGTTRKPLRPFKPSSPATWTRLQTLAASTGSVWFPPPPSESSATSRYERSYQVRRVNRALRRARAAAVSPEVATAQRPVSPRAERWCTGPATPGQQEH